MRRPRLTDTETRIRLATWAFAGSRLEDIAVLEWALALTSEQEAERSALMDVFGRLSVREPYALAWRCVFEYWQRPDAETNQDKFLIKRELKHGGIQRETIRLIVESIRPWLKVETPNRFQALSGEKPPKKPKHLKHLISASISSGGRLTPGEIGLPEIEDRDFLFELATALNASLLAGLNLAKLIGWISIDHDMTNWQVRRAYYVPEEQYPEGGGEPDRHSEGFAPASKLMFAVTERLAMFDAEAARRVIASWDISGWKLYRRLWAAAARNPELVSADDVSTFLEGLDDREFWWPSSYPEIAELRAVRWNTLPNAGKARLERRLLKGEPSKLIPNTIEKADVPHYKSRNVSTELRRIQAANGTLSNKCISFLEQEAEGFAQHVDLTSGFNQGVRIVHGGRPVPQNFGGSASSNLLEELAKALTDDRWDEKSETASGYIAENAAAILDLLRRGSDPNLAARVWQAFGYAFRPSDLNTGVEKASAEDKAKIPVAVDACRAIAVERHEVIRQAIKGLASFMGSWDRLLKDESDFHVAWLALWPFAVSETNQAEESSSSLNDRTFNTTMGQMLWALAGTFPSVRHGEDPMSLGQWPDILAALAETTGEVRLLTQSALIRDLSYLFVAAPAWTSKNLIETLINSPSPDLWESFGSADLPQREVMAELAQSIVTAAVTNEIPGKVRGDLAERVVWSLLLDRRDKSEPAVPLNLAQQMLRMGGDDVRRESVRAFDEFLDRKDDLDEQGRFEIVRSVFEDVWPKELTLSSRKVSEELAKLPAAAGPFYSDAAELVLPYLTPFDCWSLWDYGVRDHNDPTKRFSVINNEANASAFLAVLDKTVGGEDGAIIPDGLEDALAHIARLAPKLEKSVRFQRLLTLNRR
ncbi:hypothetical protein [Rhizobium rhizogenes]|uniref:hypothetical protein n=1 Tax=Rhizobium rhizogenes TaxID=359 RepID=UPI001572372E|nr:hypothetical protein [Rhizobium rhizogenes]MDJ1638565.1 hypothetical protein [Rhizobium rhizogenes]NTG75043.1 hypothetical protein [Rhizobium rhizogenes]